jgi:hypothetical protein
MLRLRHLALLLYELTALAWVNRAIGPLLVAAFLLASALIIVVGNTAAPFIYTLF